MEPTVGRKAVSIIKNWIPALTLIMVMFAFRSAIADWNDVPTGSMKPTILEGDRIFVNKLAYDLKIPFTDHVLHHMGEPERGDIVVFDSPENGKRLVKRLIGLPGDHVAMNNNRLYINGKELHYSAADDRVAWQKDFAQENGRRYYVENLDGVQHLVTVIPSHQAMRSFPEVTIPEDCYLMLGDNRDNSADSRYFGFVPRKLLAGKATTVVVSLQYDRYFLPRGDRFLKALQ